MQRLLHNLLAALSHLLNEAIGGLMWLNAFVEQHLAILRVPVEWRHGLVVGLWVVLLLILVRWLSGWLRLIALLLIGVVLARIYGMLPGV